MENSPIKRLKLKIDYQHNETATRNYQGITLDEPECLYHLKGSVKDNLIDREQRNELLDSLQTLSADKGLTAMSNFWPTFKLWKTRK